MGKLMQFGLSAALILLFGFAATKSESKDFPVAEGYVRETVTNKPIAGAYVTFVWYGKKKYAGWAEAEVVIKTDANGRFFHRSPIRNAHGWELFLRAYLPGYQMYPFLKFKNRTLLRVVDRADDEGVERTPEQLRALGYEPEPINKLTITGWVEKKVTPVWYNTGKNGIEIIYMEKANMAMNERIQEIAWTKQALNSVNQRLGPFVEYDRLRFSEATDLICRGESNISVDIYRAYERLFEDWHFRVNRPYANLEYRVNGMRQFSIPVQAQFEPEKQALDAIRRENLSRRNQRGRVITPKNYEVLCQAAKHHLEEGKP